MKQARKTTQTLGFLAYFFLAQVLVGHTELDTQTSIYNLAGQKGSLKRATEQTNLLLSRTTRHSAPDERFKLKLSPTKIKYLCTKREPIRKISHTGALNLAVHLPQESSVNFTYQRSKPDKQMAPAHAVWFDTNSVKRAPVRDISGQSTGPAQSLLKYNNTSSLLVQDESNRDRRIVQHHFNLNSVRNLLPKPINFITSQSRADTIRIRSIQVDSGELENDSEPHESLKSKTTDTSYSSPQDGLDSSYDSSRSGTAEDMPEEQFSNAQEDSESELSDQNQINFDVLENSPAQAELRSWSESPIYPPGDLDRLYSDALLIYVKDFNQYITK